MASRWAPGLTAGLACVATPSGTRADLLADRVVALALEALDQLLAALDDDAPVHHHVHELRRDVVQDPLVMGDDQRAHAELGVELVDSSEEHTSELQSPDR